MPGVSQEEAGYPGSTDQIADYLLTSYLWASLVAQLAKKLPAMWETWVLSLGWEDPLEKRKGTHSSILAWRIPWTTIHRVAKSQTRLSDFHFLIYYVIVRQMPGMECAVQ